MRNTVLITDRSAVRRSRVRELLEQRFSILEAGTEEQMQLLMEQNAGRLALVLMDFSYLEETQGEAMKKIKSMHAFSDIPVIVITLAGDPESECQALSWGADDTILWPFHSDLVMKRINTILSLYRHQWSLEGIIDEQQEMLKHSNEIVTDVLSSLIEHRSIESGNHVLRIRHFTKILLEEVAKNCPEYSLTSRTVMMISSAAALHDIGKIAIPDAILNKPGRLTPEEFEVMKGHAIEGSSIVERLGGLNNAEYLRFAYNICRYHHERWDGGGYPDGLAGDDIPICAQAVGLADVYDALTTPRVYKEAYSHSQAVNMIFRGECGQFSRQLIECFKCVAGDFEELAQKYSDGTLLPSAEISEPIPLPQRTDVNALQNLISKYDQLLSYVDAMVMEINWDQKICHIAYDPHPRLTVKQNTHDLMQTMRHEVLYNAHPDDRSMLIDRYSMYLDAFFESGLRRSEWTCRARDKNGAYFSYKVTALRIQSSSQKALCVWELSDDSKGEGSVRVRLDDMCFLGVAQQCSYDRELTMERTDEGLCELLGYSEGEIAEKFGNSFLNCIEPSKRAGVLNDLDRQFLQGNAAQVIFPMIGKKKRAVWVLAKVMLSHDDAGTEQVSFLMTDITSEEYVWKNHALSSADYQEMLERSGDIYFQWDLETDSLVCSSRWNGRFGYEPFKENVSVNLLRNSHFHPDDIPTLKGKISEVRAGARFVELMVRIANAMGQYKWNFIRAAVRWDENGKPVQLIGTLIDVSDNMLLSPAIADNAGRDSMTRLFNKDSARSQIEAYLTSFKDGKDVPLAALAVIDLDNFKEVNDRFGHLSGDVILGQVATEIRNLFRGSDIVARIGGDEFMVFMPNIPDDSVIEKRSSVLLDRVKALNSGEMADCKLSCSIGIAFAPKHGIAYQDLFQHADSALYQAKRIGKGCFVVYETALPQFISQTEAGRMGAQEQPMQLDQNIMRYVMERLYDSGDIEETIESLLEFVGRHINVSSVYIFENNMANTHCSNTFEWVNTGVRPMIAHYQNLSYETDLLDYEKNFDERGIFYCPDTKVLTGNIQRLVEIQDNRSTLQCAIRDRGMFRGFIGFDDAKPNRLWTREQVEMISVLAKTISVFLLKRRAGDREDAMAGNLRKVLNSRRSWIYVIEPETFVIRFMNDSTKELLQGRKYGQNCYRAFMNRDEPCENCPIQNERHRAIIRNEYLELDIEAVASEIDWKGKRQWLVTCKNIQGKREDSER